MCYFSWNSFSSHFIYPVWYYTMHFQIVLPSKWFFPFSLLLITKYIYYFLSIVWCHSIASVTLSFIAIYQMKCWFVFMAWRAHNLYFHAQKCKEIICIGLEFPPLIITFVFELAMSLVRVDMCFKPIQTLKFYFPTEINFWSIGNVGYLFISNGGNLVFIWPPQWIGFPHPPITRATDNFFVYKISLAGKLTDCGKSLIHC